jgi:hypothetical protein
MIEPALLELVRSTAPTAGQLCTVLVSPRYATSRHAIALLVAADGSLRYVAKLARSAGNDGGLRQEAAILNDFADRWDEARMPRLVALDTVQGFAVLVQTAVPGRPLNIRSTRRRGAVLASQVAGWASHAPVTGVSDRHWFEDRVSGPLRALAADLPGCAALVERTLEVAAPLDRAGLPVVLEHGDLREGNVLTRRSDIAVVDWETARVDGLPGADLAVFCSYVAMARRGAREPAAAAAAVRSTYAAGGAGRRLVSRELNARGVPVELTDAVLAVSSATYAATLVRRLRGSGIASADVATAAAVEVAMWEASTAVADPPEGT